MKGEGKWTSGRGETRDSSNVQKCKRAKVNWVGRDVTPWRPPDNATASKGLLALPDTLLVQVTGVRCQENFRYQVTGFGNQG